MNSSETLNPKIAVFGIVTVAMWLGLEIVNGRHMFCHLDFLFEKSFPCNIVILLLKCITDLRLILSSVFLALRFNWGKAC